MKIPLQPIHDRVLVLRIHEDRGVITRGGFSGGTAAIAQHEECVDVLDGPIRDGDAHHDDYRRAPIKGRILAVGPGKWVKPERGSEFFKPTIVQPGQVVFFSHWQDWDNAPLDHFLIMEGDIWGIVESEETKTTRRRSA